MGGFTFKAASASKVEEAFKRALYAAQEQIKTDCNFYCREDQGILKASAITQTDGGLGLQISWNTPYAKRVYYTGKPSKDKNPNASLMWAHKAKTTYNGEWIAILEKGMNGS